MSYFCMDIKFSENSTTIIILKWINKAITINKDINKNQIKWCFIYPDGFWVSVFFIRIDHLYWYGNADEWICERENTEKDCIELINGKWQAIDMFISVIAQYAIHGYQRPTSISINPKRKPTAPNMMWLNQKYICTKFDRKECFPTVGVTSYLSKAITFNTTREKKHVRATDVTKFATIYIVVFVRLRRRTVTYSHFMLVLFRTILMCWITGQLIGALVWVQW